MAVVDLKVNRTMLDVKFEGYKLSLDPVPVLKQQVVDGVKYVDLGSEDYSYLHSRMVYMLNHLFQDPWSPNSVFYVNEKHYLMWNSLGQDGRLAGPKSVWEIPVDPYMLGNVTICFPGAEWAILCDGKEHLHVLYTPSRAAGEPWLCYHSLNLGKNNSCYILHAVHRSMPGNQQIDCIVSSVEDKSCLPEDVTFPQKSTFIAVLEWISLSCAQNIQVWTKKRTRKLASPSFPEYAAIDNIGDAICVISQGHFVMFYDSNGLSKPEKIEEQEPKPPLYTYIQTPEDITVYFRLPQHIKKTDIQIKFLPLHMEVSLQGKCVLSGQLGNYINTGESTWIMDGEKLEVILSKSETGLMWQELVKGNIQGEELMDPALINEIHSRLAHLTSETEAAPSDKVPFNLAQLEECDLSNEPLTFQRIDGNQHCETHRVHMGGHQWLFSQQICPESLPAVCLRHDVDGILWQPKNVSSEGEMEQFKMEHIATFSALGYVSASKQDKKFIACSPDYKFSVISDYTRHVYLYCQPENLHSAFELRNRKTGESVAHIAKQYVVNLEQCDRMLGLRVSSECIFVLSKETLYVAKVKSK